MDIKKYFEYKKDFDNEGIIFSYSGAMTQSILEDLGVSLQSKLEYDETEGSVSRKVFAIFVEQAQNVINYSADEIIDDPQKMRTGIITIGKNDEGFFVLSGNTTDQRYKDSIVDKLEKLKNMTKEELKTHFKEQRKKPSPIDSKGAGLGFIDMARKASKPIEYHFEDTEKNQVFFAIKVVI